MRVLPSLLAAAALVAAGQEPYTCPGLSVGLSSTGPGGEEYDRKPFINGGKTFVGGVITPFGGEIIPVTSPIVDSTTNERTVIGSMAQMDQGDALQALAAAKRAWDNGQGEWPQISAKERIAALERLVASLKTRRAEIVQVLMWEIAKTTADAAAEFDRTMIFIEATLEAYRDSDRLSTWRVVQGVLARVRRAAIGIVLCLGPSNYPINETYTTLIPALLSGNVVILKLPTLGGLAHIITMEAYQQHLPAGTINFISGSGRVTMSPLMKTGSIDALAFIGGSAAADAIIKDHPHPHRLKLFLQLEGKNLGIVLPDANLDTAVEQIALGATTYNGQRCTAIKLVLLHESLAPAFLEKFVAKIGSLKAGLPWEAGVLITPLPELRRPAYLQELLADAVSKGAKVVNEEHGGGSQGGALMVPAVVFPVTSKMRLWSEEQFGPVIPIGVYKDIQEVHSYLSTTHCGQQAAVFTSNSASAGPLVDVLSTAVGRININTQCARSPDTFPFSGRRSSALGTMSITEGLNTFSIETVVATKDGGDNAAIARGLEETSRFLGPL